MTDKTVVDERDALQRFADCATNALSEYTALAQAAGYSDPLEALKAIPVKDAALNECILQLEYMDERSPSGTTPAAIVHARQALANGGTA
jgi:hypothetical protein